MGLNRKKATEVAGGDNDDYIWENLEEDSYDCRLAYIADLGLQANEYKGDFKGNFQQIALGVEVIGEGVEDEDGELLPRILWTKPFYIYDSLTEKGTELKYYKLFVPKAQEGDDPDWEAQLGKPISAEVVHVQGTGDNKDKKYDNIASLDKIPKKYQKDVGEAIAEVGIGDSDDPKNFVTKGLFGLPKFVFDKRIVEDEEEEKDDDEPAKPKKKAKKASAKKAKKASKEEDDDEDDDENPFS